MATLKKRSGFLESEEGIAVRHELEQMTINSTFNTDSGYSANGTIYPDHLMPFVDKHMNYLNAHPKIDINMYLANLRLMIRRR
jgi:hypothetical protein